MTNAKFENVLATFCSPVLLRHKVSNLVSVSKRDIPEISILVDAYNGKFETHGIKMERICECDKRILLLVYSESQLIKHLKDSEVSKILTFYGYKKSSNIEEYIETLRNRMAMEDFPHEIGVFLGYPLLDVKGFIANNGKNYNYCGYWKVYGDTAEAKKIFSIYDRLRDFVVAELNGGRELDNIVAQFKNIA